LRIESKNCLAAFLNPIDPCLRVLAPACVYDFEPPIFF